MTRNLKLLCVFFIIIFSIFICDKAYAVTDDSIDETIGIIDENGKDLTYMPRRMGGNYGWINSNLKYENCKYAIRLPANNGEQYEDTIVIDGLGTFKFVKKVDSFYSPNGYLEEISKYIYTADITDYSILEKAKDTVYQAKVKNLATDSYQNLNLSLQFYKNQFDNNAYLSYKRI